MTAVLVVLHVLSATAAAAAAARVRGGGAPGRRFELWTALLVPVAGPLLVALEVLFEGLFRRSVRPVDPAELFDPGDPEAFRRTIPDPAEVMNRGTDVTPWEETLEAGGPVRIERALRRLARPALRRVLMRVSDRDVRVRARGLWVAMEARLLREAARAAGSLERGRALRQLAELAADAATARQHLRAAAAAFREAASADPEGPALLELADALRALGDPAGACEALSRRLERRPDDEAARRARAEAWFLLGNRPALREDLARLAERDPGRADRWREGPA
jgi:tetratricopeptide (TPR) repeat protein